MAVWCELKIPSLGITVRHLSASLMMPDSYPRDRIFSLYLTTIKDSYSLMRCQLFALNTGIFVKNKYETKPDTP